MHAQVSKEGCWAPGSWSNWALRAQPAQQILGMDGLGEDVELVPFGARLFQQVGRGGLAGKEQNHETLGAAGIVRKLRKPTLSFFA